MEHIYEVLFQGGRIAPCHIISRYTPIVLVLYALLPRAEIVHPHANECAAVPGSEKCRFSGQHASTGSK